MPRKNQAKPVIGTVEYVSKTGFEIRLINDPKRYQSPKGQRKFAHIVPGNRVELWRGDFTRIKHVRVDRLSLTSEQVNWLVRNGHAHCPACVRSKHIQLAHAAGEIGGP